MQWYYARGGQQIGPVDQAALQQLLASGQVMPGDLVWNESMPNWQAAGTVPGLMGQAAVQPTVGQAPFPGQQQFNAPAPGFSSPLEYGGGIPSAKSHQGMAIGAFVCSLVGILCANFILGPVALILGFVALNGMRQSGNRSGRGLAIAAIVIGICDLVIFIATMGFMFAMRH